MTTTAALIGLLSFILIVYAWIHYDVKRNVKFRREMKMGDACKFSYFSDDHDHVYTLKGYIVSVDRKHGTAIVQTPRATMFDNPNMRYHIVNIEYIYRP